MEPVATQTVLWLLVMVGLFAVAFILMPPEHSMELSRFGMWFGLVQALLIMYIFQARLNVFRINYDIPLFEVDIPLLATFSWIPPAILFARFWPSHGGFLIRTGYVSLFAVGATLVQYVLETLGMWESINWNLGYTFLLGIVAHTLMATYMSLRKIRINS